MANTKLPPTRFAIGDWVTVVYGAQPVLARVVEDRGPLGVNQRRLYSIELLLYGDEPCIFETPEENLQSADECKNAMSDYLRQGGLVDILKLNLSGGKKSVQVWLACSSGDVEYTRDSERGGVGGAAVPFYALHKDRVFTPMKDEVIDFITTFGFNLDEAESIVRAVGVAP